MADSTITGLTAVTTAALTDTTNVRQSGDTRDKKETLSQVLALFLANSSVDQLLSTTTAIDAKSATATNLYTVPAGKSARITRIVINCTAASGVLSVITAGVGVAAGEADIIPSQAITGLDTAGQSYVINTTGLSALAAAAAVIKFGIDVAATGTSQTLSVNLYGILS